MTAPATPGDRAALVCWIAAPLLVLAFVNVFPLWQAATRLLGKTAAWLPGVLLAGLVAAGFLAAWRRRPWNLPALAAAILVLGAGLLLADPAFPAKRVHVPEYALLALILRRALAPALSGLPQTILAAILAALGGVHDEMIQGLLPDRTFGLADIAVNGCGAAGGALLGAGLRIAPGRGPAGVPPSVHNWPSGMILVGVALLVAGTPSFIDLPLPFWLAAPLLAAGAAQLILPASADPAGRRIEMYLALAALPLAIYPLLSHAPGIRFH